MLFSQVSRKQAFLTHLGVSACIFFILTYFIVFQWYPSFYFFHDGGDRAMMTIFFVDVVLGPGLTLLVFKQGKKGLKFDLAIILILQASALTWGIKSVYVGRPVLTVFYNGQFYCMGKYDVPEKEVERLSENYTSGPLLALLRRPDQVGAYFNFMNDAYQAEDSEIYFYNDRFEPINESSIQRIKSYELNVEEGIIKTRQRISQSKESWEQYKKANPVRDGVGYYPLKCRYRVGTVVFDFSQGKIIDSIDVYTKPATSSIGLINDVVDRERVDSVKQETK